MKVVILAGGLGTRISEESKFRPKPMIEIGEMPIIWHIMKAYSHYGFNDFIICAGYKQHMVKEWFYNYFMQKSDIKFSYKNGKQDFEILNSDIEPWEVSVVDTGYSTMTGGRVKRIQKYIGDETFMLTYGDGVCDVNINELLEFHKSHGKIATITSIIQKQQKGVLELTKLGEVRNFREKKNGDGAPINAGFMVLEPKIFDYLIDDTTVLEAEPMEKLVEDGELMSYTHRGFWQCMDSLREKEVLEEMWQKNKAPWKVWN